MHSSKMISIPEGSFVNQFSYFRVIISENGIRELYRGLAPILLRNGPSNAVFFVLREEAQKLPQMVRRLL